MPGLIADNIGGHQEIYPLVDLNHCYRVEKTQRPRPLDEGGTDDFENEPPTVNNANRQMVAVFPYTAVVYRLVVLSVHGEGQRGSNRTACSCRLPRHLFLCVDCSIELDCIRRMSSQVESRYVRQTHYQDFRYDFA